jgi:hypothetical protein
MYVPAPHKCIIKCKSNKEYRTFYKTKPGVKFSKKEFQIEDVLITMKD